MVVALPAELLKRQQNSGSCERWCITCTEGTIAVQGGKLFRSTVSALSSVVQLG